MDDQRKRKSWEDQEEKKKKKRRTLPIPNEIKVPKLDARTGDDPAKKLPLEKQKQKQKKKKHSALKLEELQNHHLEDASPHRRNATGRNEDMHEGQLHRDIVNEEGKIKKKKKKKTENMDVNVSLHREIEEERELQQEDEHSPEENLHTENNKGEKKRGKKKKEKKREEEGDQHSQEGNLLRENDKGLEKRRNKKEKKREEEEENTETPSQMIPSQSSCGDHELRKEKKAKRLEQENGMGEDFSEGVVYANEKMAKKAKQTQDILCISGGEVGSYRSVKEDESTSSKARKYSKESRYSAERGSYDPARNEDHNLLSYDIECGKGPLADQLQHVTSPNMTIDSCPKEKEERKKKERKRKRVTFQDKINITDQEHARDIPNAACENSMEIVEEVWGVRFTAEEDEILKDAILKYIKSKGWDEQEGLNKVFNSKKHKDAHNCWADIKLSLPHRPRPAIRYRAHLLLEKGAHAGKWSEEEEQLLKRLQGEHGGKWKEISALIDRHRTSIKEKWRSLKRMKGKGVWTQAELQQLFDLVHKCLRARASIRVENKNPDHHILRDNINWEKIADTIGTHNHGSCCGKWYYNLQSSLVADGLWANEDDSLLLESLLESGACTEEEAEWDSLLNHRSGQVCLMRWKQMLKQLGENRTQPFLNKLDILAHRYAPELLESSVKEISTEDSSIKEKPPLVGSK